jgi:hypothetical protein
MRREKEDQSPTRSLRAHVAIGMIATPQTWSPSGLELCGWRFSGVRSWREEDTIVCPILGSGLSIRSRWYDRGFVSGRILGNENIW